MQFCQPTGFQPPGFNYHRQPSGFHASISLPYFNGYPDIIGEGKVTTVISPDGSAQLLFLPTMQWSQWRTMNHPLDPQYPCTGNLGNPYLYPQGAWLVRNSCNPMHPPMFCQPLQDCYSLQYARECASDCCVNLSPPLTMPQTGFPLKFHNDNCTSTSDIHYFIPKQCAWFRAPTNSAAVQVEVPTVANAACNYETFFPSSLETRPCNCPMYISNSAAKEEQEIECMCSKESKVSLGRMSVDSTKSKHKNKSHKSNGKSKSRTTYYSNTSNSDMSVDCAKSTHKHNKAKSHKPIRTKSKKSHTCECKELKADKAVTTYVEQGIGCAPDTGRETQTADNNSSHTSCHGVPVIQVSMESCKSKVKSPKASRNKRVSEPQSCDSITFISDSASCTCTSGTELTDY